LIYSENETKLLLSFFVPRWTQKGDNTTANIDIIVVYCAIRKHTIDQLHLINECKKNYICISFGDAFIPIMFGDMTGSCS
jgi:hypothetical protein